MKYAANMGRTNAIQVLMGWQNRILPITGIFCMNSGKMMGKVSQRLVRVSDIMENSISVAPRHSILIIRPVTTWFVRRETVR